MTGECPNCRPGATCAACLDDSPVVAWCDPRGAWSPVPVSASVRLRVADRFAPVPPHPPPDPMPPPLFAPWDYR